MEDSPEERCPDFGWLPHITETSSTRSLVETQDWKMLWTNIYGQLPAFDALWKPSCAVSSPVLVQQTTQGCFLHPPPLRHHLGWTLNCIAVKSAKSAPTTLLLVPCCQVATHHVQNPVPCNSSIHGVVGREGHRRPASLLGSGKF